MHPWRIAPSRLGVDVVNILEDGSDFAIQAIRPHAAVGSHTLDMQRAVILCADGAEGIYHHFHRDDIPLLYASAGAHLSSERPLAVQIVEVVVTHIPEITPWARIMVGIAIVHAALVPLTSTAPSADIVALLDFHSGDLVPLAIR